MVVTLCHCYRSHCQAPDAPVAPEKGAVRVRFINTPDGKDVITTAIEGENLLKVSIGNE